MNKSIFSDKKGNELRLSSVLQADQKVHFQHFSAKYVVSGHEKYTVNNRKMEVKPGEYVIGNTATYSNVFIDGASPAKGICIDIAKDYISEIIHYRYHNPTDFEYFLFEQEWMAQKYHTHNTALGYALHQLASDFEQLNTGTTQINQELFYAVAECIVQDQSVIFQRLNNLKVAKHETTGRLFNYICDAKNYMDHYFLEKISLEALAREAKLSEYHFIRLFKVIFNATPYQYLLQKRLAYSKELLQQQHSIQEVAFLTSFADSAAYCKAFKLVYGLTPKQFSKVN